jgi:hypothetical protein
MNNIEAKTFSVKRTDGQYFAFAVIYFAVSRELQSSLIQNLFID